jgi:hypothetical protein
LPAIRDKMDFHGTKEHLRNQMLCWNDFMQVYTSSFDSKNLRRCGSKQIFINQELPHAFITFISGR